MELDQTGALNNDIVIVNDMMNGPSGKVDAVKIAEAVLLYLFTMVFPTSLFPQILVTFSH